MDGTGPLRKMHDPMEYIRFCEACEYAATVPEHLVPTTQFLCIRRSDNKLVGMIQVRHCFNDFLKHYGGHIGYCVRPDERKKGYAREMLGQVLPFCKEIGIDRVLITCIDGNTASERTIMANGGVYESTVYEANANVHLKRFWVDPHSELANTAKGGTL